jgi:hypothetical protein
MTFATPLRPAFAPAFAALLVLVLATIAADHPNAARADEASAVIESSARFESSGIVHEVRVFLADASQDEANEALDAVLASRGYPDPDDQDGVEAAFASFAQWLPDHSPVVVEYNPDSDPVGLSLYSPILYAIDAWNSVEYSWFRFEYGGEAYLDTCSFDATGGILQAGPNFDGHNVVRFGDFSSLGGYGAHILGITCSSWDDVTGEYFEFDMELSVSQPWSMFEQTPSDRFDLYTTVLHEFGHAMGLSHSSAPNAVMQRSARAGTPVRSLTEDDILGVQSLYYDPDYTPPPQAQRGSFRLAVGGVAGGAGIPTGE